MGVRDVSVSLLAPGWKLVSEPSPTKRMVSGEPVPILHPERILGAKVADIDPSTVAKWLLEREFNLEQQGPSFMILRSGPVEAFFSIDGGVLAEINLTFALDKHSPTLVPEWKGIAEGLCRKWEFEFGDDTHSFTVGLSEFVQLLTSHPTWNSFAAYHKWPSIES